MKSEHWLFFLLSVAVSPACLAAPQIYTIQPAHTYPSFEVSHRGISHWRGKFTKTSGSVWLDRAHDSGKLDIMVDTTSISFGLPVMDQVARGEDYFNVAKYPMATYHADAIVFKQGRPFEAHGSLTLLGITKPVTLHITSFKCMEHPVLHRQVCGADVYAEFDRREFGMTREIVPEDPNVRLEIQVEAIEGDTLPALPARPPAASPAAPSP